MCIKFCQFQNNSCVSCLTIISGAPIDDLIGAFCVHSIFRKSHQIFLMLQKLSGGLFLPPSATYGLMKSKETTFTAISCYETSFGTPPRTPLEELTTLPNPLIGRGGDNPSPYRLPSTSPRRLRRLVLCASSDPPHRYTLPL